MLIVLALAFVAFCTGFFILIDPTERYWRSWTPALAEAEEDYRTGRVVEVLPRS